MLAATGLLGHAGAAESKKATSGKDADNFMPYVQLAPFVVNGKQLTISIHARSEKDRRYAEAFAEAIRDAQLRGYMPGRRVRLWSGDLHMGLGERARAEARGLKGPERMEQLERAAAAYGRCIEQFDGYSPLTKRLA